MNPTEIRNEEPAQQAVPTNDELDEGSALEALRTENEELKMSIRFSKAENKITQELASAGARTPRMLAEVAKAKFQFDDDGKLVNSAALVEQLQKDFPEQFGSDRHVETIDGGAGTGRAASSLTREALARMTPAQIAELDWNEVRTVLSGR